MEVIHFITFFLRIHQKSLLHRTSGNIFWIFKDPFLVLDFYWSISVNAGKCLGSILFYYVVIAVVCYGYSIIDIYGSYLHESNIVLWFICMYTAFQFCKVLRKLAECFLERLFHRVSIFILVKKNFKLKSRSSSSFLLANTTTLKLI